MTEQQEYEVLETHGSLERRRYAACVVADVAVGGSVEGAGTAAFRPLVSYISGANLRRGAFTTAMAPDASGERMAMTAPVIQQAADDGAEDRWIVSFVLPGGRDVDDYPEPTDPRVRLRALPAHEAAAIRWSGRWSADNVATRTEELRRALDQHGWVAVAQARWARFDPPWKPAFLRRNEIVIPVDSSSAANRNEPTLP